MKTLSTTLKVLTCAVFIMALTSLAQAQTRTWVSGVGDDLNPCSRTAPCKTYAGAISKTSKDGEISTLDPGGFGTVTITKSITINGTHGAGYGSILAAGTNGVIINITDAADVRKTVRLRSLDINGVSTGINGIRVLSALKVYVEGTAIDGFTNRGIDDVRTTANGQLYIADTVVRNTTQSSIGVQPGVGGSTTAMITDVRVEGSGNAGFVFSANSKSTVKNSFSTGHTSHGLFADGGEVTVENSVLSHNGSTGIFVTAPAVVRLSNSTITNNGSSINVAGQPQVQSAGTSVIAGNGANNFPTGTAIVLK